MDLLQRCSVQCQGPYYGQSVEGSSGYWGAGVRVNFNFFRFTFYWELLP